MIANSIICKGVTRLLDKLYCNDVQIAGTATFASITATGAISGATLTTTGNASIGGTLGVTGAATFSNTLSATGNITSTANLYATGGYLYLAGKAVMDGGKTSANWITINNGQFSSGTYIKGTLKTDTANITNLTATSASFSGDVTVNGVLNSTEMQTNIVKAVGGQLYVSPTYIPSVNGTILCTGATTDYVTFTISDFTSITGLTYGGANWYSGSKIMFTGVITGNKGGNPQVVFASVPGELTANMNSTANKLQIKVYYDKASTYFESSNTNLTYSDMSVMMYQINSSGTLYPIGIYIKAYGNDNKNSYIDIYGGLSNSPDARIGLLTGLKDPDNPNQDLKINGNTVQGWGLMSTYSYLRGTIVASSGTIGGWGIGTNTLTNGTLGTTNSIWLLTADRDNADAKAIGGSTSLTTWRLAVGNNFGVTKEGTLYASSAEISGKITATTGYIGGTSGFTITSGKIYSNNHSAYNTAVSGVYIGTDYISLGSGGVTYFKNDGTGKIGPWNITSTSIYKTNSTMGSSAAGSAYFGDNGLSITDKFQVTSAGLLSATGADISGEIHASSGSTFGDLTKSYLIVGDKYLDMYYNNTNIFHFGYDSGIDSQGRYTNAPYYTLGTRKSNGIIGNYSTSIGLNNEASGYVSFASGHNTTASGTWSFTSGYETTASGTDSHAEGESSVASGYWSHAEGYETVASGHRSHAEGYQSVASGQFSHAQNEGTESAVAAQTVIGTYNKIDSQTIDDTFTGNGTTKIFQLSNSSELVEAYELADFTINGNSANGWKVEDGYLCLLKKEYRPEVTYYDTSNELITTSVEYWAQEIELENVDTTKNITVSGETSTVFVKAYLSEARLIFDVAPTNGTTIVTKAYYTTHPSGDSVYGRYAFIIGNGSYNNSRSNALTVDWSGNLVASGSLTGASLSISGTTAKVNNSDILTKASVINNLTTSTTNVPLSAAQGKALKDTLDTVGVLSATNGSNINLTANTEVTICTLSLSAGTYICTGDVHWPSSSTDAVKKLRVKASTGAYATQQVRTQWYTETNATLMFVTSSACTLSLTAESAIALSGASGILRAVRVK